jgi:hypothetical protein
MTSSRVLLGVCGLYCGACYHYRASYPESKHLLEEAARQGRALEGFACQGCRSDALYVHPGCAQCEIRACAEDRGILHCGLCAEFPCDRLEAFRNDGRVHHLDAPANLEELKAKGVERWLAEQERRWTCGCEKRFSWHETACSRCGASLDSYGPDPAKQWQQLIRHVNCLQFRPKSPIIVRTRKRESKLRHAGRTNRF